MNRLFYRYCLWILLLLGSWQSAQAQGGDPFCHLQVISGAPAWFDFNKASDYTAGKTLYYNTVIKVQFNKRPDKIWVYSTAESNTFDGPTSGLASSNFQISWAGVWRILVR
ncbi:MAG: hypothetical protein MJZ61_08155 [Bacteroidales bacterium]|nr:hypothetical protein [Bacteroidales bacterium]